MGFIDFDDGKKEELVSRCTNHKKVAVGKRVQSLILFSLYYSMKGIIETAEVSRATLCRFLRMVEYGAA